MNSTYNHERNLEFLNFCQKLEILGKSLFLGLKGK